MMPGAFNGLCGRLVRDQGFEAAYISGAAVSASVGVPDIGVPRPACSNEPASLILV